MLTREKEEKKHEKTCEKIHKIREEFPKMFFACFDFGIGPGWLPMVYRLIKKLHEISPDTKVLQIKEKFAGLRFYANTNEEGQKLIDKVEKKSYNVCEFTGKHGTEHRLNGWYKTCSEEYYEFWKQDQERLKKEYEEKIINK